MRILDEKSAQSNIKWLTTLIHNNKLKARSNLAINQQSTHPYCRGCILSMDDEQMIEIGKKKTYLDDEFQQKREG